MIPHSFATGFGVAKAERQTKTHINIVKKYSLQDENGFESKTKKAYLEGLCQKIGLRYNRSYFFPSVSVADNRSMTAEMALKLINLLKLCHVKINNYSLSLGELELFKNQVTAIISEMKLSHNLDDAENFVKELFYVVSHRSADSHFNYCTSTKLIVNCLENFLQGKPKYNKIMDRHKIKNAIDKGGCTDILAEINSCGTTQDENSIVRQVTKDQPANINLATAPKPQINRRQQTIEEHFISKYCNDKKCTTPKRIMGENTRSLADIFACDNGYVFDYITRPVRDYDEPIRLNVDKSLEVQNQQIEKSADKAGRGKALGKNSGVRDAKSIKQNINWVQDEIRRGELNETFKFIRQLRKDLGYRGAILSYDKQTAKFTLTPDFLESYAHCAMSRYTLGQLEIINKHIQGYVPKCTDIQNNANSVDVNNGFFRDLYSSGIESLLIPDKSGKIQFNEQDLRKRIETNYPRKTTDRRGNKLDPVQQKACDDGLLSSINLLIRNTVSLVNEYNTIIEKVNNNEKIDPKTITNGFWHMFELKKKIKYGGLIFRTIKNGDWYNDKFIESYAKYILAEIRKKDLCDLSADDIAFEEEFANETSYGLSDKNTMGLLGDIINESLDEKIELKVDFFREYGIFENNGMIALKDDGQVDVDQQGLQRIITTKAIQPQCIDIEVDHIMGIINEYKTNPNDYTNGLRQIRMLKEKIGYPLDRSMFKLGKNGGCCYAGEFINKCRAYISGKGLSNKNNIILD